jgi:hypothetical protein
MNGITFQIIYFMNNKNNEILTSNINELNKIILDIESQFISSVKNSIFNRDWIKEEFILYRNEIGIEVKGQVKNYKITNDLLEFIFKERCLRKNSKDNFQPFYYKKICVKRYVFDDIIFQLKLGFIIQDSKIDIDV